MPFVSVRNCDRNPIETARRNPELETDATAAVIDHLGHDALARAELRDHDALEVLGHVDDEILDGLDADAVDLLRHDLGTRHLQLESLAPHHLDQDRQLQLAAADHLHLLGRFGVLDAQRDVAQQLPRQTIAQVTRGDILPVAPGHRRRVDTEDHRHRGLVDGGRRNRHAILGIGDRFTDSDVLDAGEADDVTGCGGRDVHALQPLEREQLGDFRLLLTAVELQYRDLIADAHLAVEDAANRDATQVIARVEVRHQELERRLDVPAWRRDVVDDRVEQRPKVGAWRVELARGRAGASAGVQHGKFDLLLGGVEIDEEIVDLVQHLRVFARRDDRSC